MTRIQRDGSSVRDLHAVPCSLSASCISANLQSCEETPRALFRAWKRLRPTVQPTLYQQNRVCVCVCENAGLINIPPTHQQAHTHTPKGASVTGMAKGCCCLRDGVLLLLALGTSPRPEPEWRAHR